MRKNKHTLWYNQFLERIQAKVARANLRLTVE